MKSAIPQMVTELVHRKSARIAQLEAALVEERARGNWGAEGNIDWEEQDGYSFGYGDDEIGVQDFYRREARAQLTAEGLLRVASSPA